MTNRSVARQLIKAGDGVPTPYRVVYQVYMASPEWRRRRDAFLDKFRRKCRACGGTDEIQVHHRSYERFTREADEDLAPLCTTCHQWVHHYERSSSATLQEATDAVIMARRQVVARKQEPVAVGRQRSPMDKAFAAARKAQAKQTARGSKSVMCALTNPKRQ